MRLTIQKGIKSNFILLEPSLPQTDTVQNQERTPPIERDPLGRKGRLWWAINVLRLLGTSRRTHFGFTPSRDQHNWNIQRWQGTEKKIKDYQYQPHNKICNSWQKLLSLKISMPSRATIDFLHILLFFALSIYICKSQSPESLPAYPLSLRDGNLHWQPT